MPTSSLISMPLISFNVSHIVPAITIVSPIQLDDTPCPVNDDNRQMWMEEQRKLVAEGCIWAKDLAHLVKMVSQFHSSNLAHI